MPGTEFIRVTARVRPSASAVPQERVVEVVDKKNICFNPRNPRGFTFDAVFDENVTQEQVFDELGSRIVDGCVDGFNGTIFAYALSQGICLFPKFHEKLKASPDKGKEHRMWSRVVNTPVKIASITKFFPMSNSACSDAPVIEKRVNVRCMYCVPRPAMVAPIRAILCGQLCNT
ncbi:unnamed protein product [Heligmosomoides polygyrus]|uniref:Kinesin motor domain-containing protein n=1 Tax=Heligmosomoides polygyrus TaxID=6339 RepID=A0A183GCK8_HELPZ|nr:unnamed protein product [Heligmosomoides polygyrus]